jgi:hypothetical protein
MDVKEAVATAKKYVEELFGDEGITNVGLEEVVFDEANNNWNITIGFNRPWDAPMNVFGAIAQATRPSRSFKIVEINDNKEVPVSVRNREN